LTKGDPFDRIKNANQQPTYLMEDVKVIMDYQCYNMNTNKLEKLLHNFFGESCLNITIADNNGREHTPRKWFIAPIKIIEEAVQLIISGEIIKYKYDHRSEQILSIE
jgi:hypothetical protein